MKGSKEMREQLSEKMKSVEEHRKVVCEYLNIPMRQKDEEVCKKIDSLCFQYRILGSLEEKIKFTEMLERKEVKEGSIH